MANVCSNPSTVMRPAPGPKVPALKMAMPTLLSRAANSTANCRTALRSARFNSIPITEGCPASRAIVAATAAEEEAERPVR